MRSRPVCSLMTLLVVPWMAACEAPVVKVFEYVASAPIYSTPALTQELIIFGSENGDESAINRKGEFVWKYSTRREVVSAIKVADNMVFFGSTNNTFYALDQAGQEVWKYTTLGRIKGDPLVLGKTVVVGSYDKYVYGLSKVKGSRLWTFPPMPGVGEAAPPPAATPTPVAAKPAGAAPAGTAPAAEPVQPVVERVEPGDAFSYSSPIAVGNMVVLGNLDGHLYALEAETGKFLWRFKTDGADVRKGVTSTVLEHGDSLVFGANDGFVYAISKDGQKVHWKFKTGDEVNATAVADGDGNLYIGGVDRTFYSLDKSGKERWRYALKGPVMGRAAIMKNLVIFAGGSGDNSIYAVDRNNGKLFWTFTTGGKIEADMVVEDNRLYAASGDKHLYCFQFNKTAAE